MKNIDLWFGDSYTVGAELANHYGDYNLNLSHHRFVRPERDRPDLAFPHLVSTARNVDYISFGSGNSSISWQLYNLIQFCKNEIRSNCKYTAFFCLPFAERNFLIDNEFNHHHINKPKWNEHHSYLDFVTYNTTLILNQLYLLCEKYNIEPYFFSQMTSIEINTNINILPDSAWLIEPSKCLVNETWQLDKEIHTWRNIIEMLANQHVYLKFISPCENHPNLIGQQSLADKILQELEKR